MKIFQSTIHFLETLGITSQTRPINVRSLVTILAFGTMTILICASFWEANNFKEYTESIYMSSVTIVIFVTFLFVIWKKENVFEFIDCWEKIAETSKFYLQLLVSYIY